MTTHENGDQTVNDPMPEKWDAALEEVRRMSDMLNGFVTTLINEGWSEQQARTLVIASFVASTK